ncbi:MAG: hypothetical protein J5700_02000, partial [Treponema sp.]|nr:hypothetical protein [Treponema sp.]
VMFSQYRPRLRAAFLCLPLRLFWANELEAIKTRRENADGRSLCALILLLRPKRRNREKGRSIFPKAFFFAYWRG